MASRFRLLDLNEDCLKTVLQCFDGLDLISFSLCSKKMLANVRSLKFHIELRLICGTTFNAYFNFGGHLIELFFCENGYDRLVDQRDDRPRRLQVDYIEGCYPYAHLDRQDDNQELTIRRWRRANFRGNDWLRHFMVVFNCDKIGSMFVEKSKFEVDSVVDIVQNLNIASFGNWQNITKQHTLSLLRAQPCLENLSVDALTFDEPSEYSILLRNQQRLNIQTTEITRDIALSVNSLALHCSGLSINDANRFIKLWKKGANPRLRYLWVIFIANHAGAVALNENEVLRGIQYRRMPQGTVRMFEMPGNRMEEIDGGFDIIGKNGRKATVILYNHEEEEVSFFQMFIWQ